MHDVWQFYLSSMMKFIIIYPIIINFRYIPIDMCLISKALIVCTLYKYLEYILAWKYICTHVYSISISVYIALAFQYFLFIVNTYNVQCVPSTYLHIDNSFEICFRLLLSIIIHSQSALCLRNSKNYIHWYNFVWARSKELI